MLLGLQTWVTMKAFFSDSKSTTIYINNHGEMYGDIFTFMFFWIICLIGLILLLRRIKPELLKK
jgi:hypothetical protein